MGLSPLVIHLVPKAEFLPHLVDELLYLSGGDSGHRTHKRFSRTQVSRTLAAPAIIHNILALSPR